MLEPSRKSGQHLQYSIQDCRGAINILASSVSSSILCLYSPSSQIHTLCSVKLPQQVGVRVALAPASSLHSGSWLHSEQCCGEMEHILGRLPQALQPSGQGKTRSHHLDLDSREVILLPSSPPPQITVRLLFNYIRIRTAYEERVVAVIWKITQGWKFVNRVGRSIYTLSHWLK